MLVRCSGGVKKVKAVNHCWLTTFGWMAGGVEYSGLEPLTSTLPVSRSSQMS